MCDSYHMTMIKKGNKLDPNMALTLNVVVLNQLLGFAMMN